MSTIRQSIGDPKGSVQQLEDPPIAQALFIAKRDLPQSTRPYRLDGSSAWRAILPWRPA